jgi:hypothetical protein
MLDLDPYIKIAYSYCLGSGTVVRHPRIPASVARSVPFLDRVTPRIRQILEAEHGRHSAVDACLHRLAQRCRRNTRAVPSGRAPSRRSRDHMTKQLGIVCCVGLAISLLGCSSDSTGGGASGGSAGAPGSGGTGGATGGSGGSTAGTGGATGGTAGSTGGTSANLGACRIFPPDNPWNTDVSGYALSADSATYLANMAPGSSFHPDWGTVTDGYGFPFSTGTGATPQPITWTAGWGATESDPLPCPTGTNQFCYPIPLTAPIEGGPSASTDSDRHVLYVDTAGAPNDCTLYELYNGQNPTGNSGWTAANGAIFHLGSNALRPDGWTSADAAGLPVLPGLVRFDEVTAGEIRHAIRFTMNRSQQGYIHPATHAAGNADTTLPPMGLRLRLAASFDTSGFTGPTLVIMTAMKRYGIILADNGSNWYISGESNEGWAAYMDDLLTGLGQVHGSDFEVVDTGPVSTNGL